MNRNSLVAIAALVSVAPMAVAHDPAGTPKNYCEDPSEWHTHDYGPPGTGTLIALGQDGNLAGDCNGDTIPADFDDHVEYALGGGWLDVETGDGVTGGTMACYGVVGHHPFFGPVSVNDAVVGTTISFTVTADTVNLVPPTDPAAPNCGDFEADETIFCPASPCSVPFPPGLDGTYPVFPGEVPLLNELENLLGDLGVGTNCCTADCFFSSCSCCGTTQSCYCSFGTAYCQCSSGSAGAPGTAGHIMA